MSVSVEVSQQPSGGSETPLESSLLPSPNPTKSFWQESFPSDIAEHRTTQKLPAQADVVIIGSGISGAFAAHRLWTFRGMERQARRIVVLEARNVCSAATGRVCINPVAGKKRDRALRFSKIFDTEASLECYLESPRPHVRNLETRGRTRTLHT